MFKLIKFITCVVEIILWYSGIINEIIIYFASLVILVIQLWTILLIIREPSLINVDQLIYAEHIMINKFHNSLLVSTNCVN